MERRFAPGTYVRVRGTEKVRKVLPPELSGISLAPTSPFVFVADANDESGQKEIYHTSELTPVALEMVTENGSTR